jgi:phage/plasmid-like protein (TIGR03299 family)
MSTAIINGEKAFFSNYIRGLGDDVQGAQTWEEAMQLAHLDWEVEKRPLFDGNGRQVAAWGTFRIDEDVFLGAVGDKYTPIQNKFAFDFVDALMGIEGGAHYEAAGALGNGEKIFCFAKIPQDFLVDGQDPQKTWLMFASSHDGSAAAQAKLCIIRPACTNVLNRALRMNGTFTRVKHTAKAEERLKLAQKMMAGAVTSVKEVQDKLTALSYKILNKETYVNILDRLFPGPKKADASTTRRDNLMADITRLFEYNDGNAFPDFRGTSYNLLNAITEYTDHHRGTRITQGRQHLNVDTARRETALFGSGDVLKQEAFEVIYEMSSGLPDRPYKTYSQRAIGSGEYPVAPTGGLLDSVIDNTQH